MTFEARDSAAKVVPARFRLQRPRSPIRRKNVTPAGLQAAGVSGSRRSAGSQTRWGENQELSEGTSKQGKPGPTLSPRRQSHDVSRLGRVPSGPHQNHQQLLQLLARRRKEEISDLTNFSKQPLGAPHAPLKRSPSAPSALHRLHRLPHPPRPPDALLPSLPSAHPQENSHTRVTRTWSRGSKKHSPVCGGRRQHPVLRRQALSVDQGTAAAACTMAAPFVVHDYPHNGGNAGGDEESQPSHRRTATVVCHHESYSPLIGYGSGGDEVRGEVKEEEEEEGLLKVAEGEKGDREGSGVNSAVVDTAVVVEVASKDSPLLGAVGGMPELTDVDAVKPFPEVIPEVRVRPMLGQRARSDTARRHQLTRQKPVNGDENG